MSTTAGADFSSGQQVPGAAAAVGTFTAGTPFSSGQQINVVIPPNSTFAPTSGQSLNILECTAPGKVIPTDPAACDGNTVQGPSFTANPDGSVDFQALTGSLYKVYALPDNLSLGEGSGGGQPQCSLTVPCVLFIGLNQNDFTAAHLWSQFFYVQPNRDDLGEFPGDGSPPPPATTTTLTAAPPSPSTLGQTVTLTATVAPVGTTSCTTPTGQVNFYSGTTLIGASTVASGQAQLMTSTLTAGSHSPSATYSGSAACGQSSSTTQTYVVISPKSGDQIPGSAVAVPTFNAGTPFSSGQQINVVVPPNNALPVGQAVHIEECAAPGMVLPTDPSACDGNTVEGPTVTVNSDGSMNFNSETGSLYSIYALPDSVSLGETSSNPTVCNATAPCVLYIGVNQNDFTQPHFFSNFFFVQPNADDKGEFPGDGSAPPTPTTTTTLTPSVSSSVFGQSVTLTASIMDNTPQTCAPSGSVTFKDGSTTLDTGTITPSSTALTTSGQATFTTSSLIVGSHSLTAVFTAAAGCPGSTSSATSFIVSQASTTTALSAVPSGGSTVTQSVTLTATVAAVAPGVGTPTGSVTFKDGTTTLGSSSLGGGVATLTTSTLGTGSRSLTATYGGDTNFTGSQGSLIYNVSLASTTTQLAPSPTSPSVFGQPVTFTATVAPTAPATTSPTGTVTFMDGTATLGSQSLNGSGVATLTVSTLTPGPHTITAVYGGDSNDNGSTSGVVNYTVDKAATTTSVSAGSPASPSVFGQSVSFTATVTAVGPGAGTPTGSVTFTESGTSTQLGTVSLSGGSATIMTSALPVGSDTVLAAYSSDNDFLASSATTGYTVNQASTSTTLSSVPASPSVFGQSVTLTATVAVVAPGQGTPGGNVTFKDGSTTLGSSAVNNSGIATLTTSSLSVGTHALMAIYAGATAFAGSSSSTNSFVVNKAGSTSALTSSANPSAPGASVTFTDTVSAQSPGAGSPSGTVTFMDGSTPIGTAQTLSGAVASIAMSTLAVGTHTISAVYGGDADFATSTSNGVSQSVTAYSTTTSLSSSLNPSKANTSVTFSATVTGSSSAAGTPTGSVAFRDGAALLGSAALNGSGVATLTTSTLAVGTHGITAVYGGDANFATSTSGAVSQVVQASGGYWIVASDGGVFTFGSAPFLGSLGALHLNQPIVGMAPTPDGRGYWLVARDGGIFTFGDAQFHGSVPQIATTLRGIVGMVVDQATGGYWIINSDGTIFNFDAPNKGTLPFFGFHVRNIVGGAASPDGQALYLVGSDGQVYTMLGTATHQGSLAGQRLNAPIIGMTLDPASGGYWLLGGDGGVFGFNAPFFGSTGSLVLRQPVVGITPTSDGGGYWLVARDGGVFSFGDAVFSGSTGSLSLNAPVVGMAASG